MLFRLALFEKKDEESLKEIMQWTKKKLVDGIPVQLYAYSNELCKFYFFPIVLVRALARIHSISDLT